MVKMLSAALCSLFILATGLAGYCSGTGNPSSTAESELSVLTGYGITHHAFGDTVSQVQTYDLIARYGHFLSGEIGRGRWFQGRHVFYTELPLHIAVDRSGRSMAGVYFLGGWKFTGLEKVSPYIFAGGGPLYVDLGLPSMGSRLCFSYQGGTGVQRFIGENMSLGLEYRYHHISNAGTASPNEPLNSSKILFGITFHR